MITNSSQGIVEMIQRKKDAYQDNPQALQQRYQQNKQLTDLLALQQLKTEKEAAARDIQLKMQQNPQTIAQQREQQVLGLIKQEQGRNLGKVTEQVGGVLGQRQKESMQRQKRMGMAQGGIVGFQSGEMVDGEDEDIETVSVVDAVAAIGKDAFNYVKENPLEAALLGLTVTGIGGLAIRGGIAALRSQTVRSAIQNLMKGKKPDFEVTPKGTAVPTDRSGITSRSKELIPSGPIEAGKQLVPYGRGASMNRPTAALTGIGAAGLGLGALTQEDKETTVPGVELTDYAKSRLSDVGEARRRGFPSGPNEQNKQNEQNEIGSIDRKGLTERFKLTPPDVEVGTTRQDATKGILDDLGQTARVGRDLDTVRADRMAGVKDEMGLAGIKTKKQSQIDRLRKQQEQLAERDPFEAFIAGTVGAAQRGGPGGFAAGYIGKLSQQRAQQRQNLKDEFGIENELLDIEQDVLSKGIDSADKAERVLSEEKRAYASAMSQATTGDISAAEKEAERILDANIQNIKTELDLLGQETDRAIAAAELRGAELADLEELLQEELKRRDELLSPILTALVDNAQSGYGDVESAVNQATLIKGFILDKGKVFAREEDLLRRMEALGVDVSSQKADLAEERQRLELMGQYLKSQQ
tara:strand:+ start:548 stop:2467 length:1920 start_codon:yes stop_codon:yes gene_type:complete